MTEAEFLCFGDALIGTEGRTNLAAEADFAENDVFLAELTSGDGGGDSHADGEVGGGIVELDAANDVDEDVFIGQAKFCAAL